MSRVNTKETMNESREKKWKNEKLNESRGKNEKMKK